MASETEMKIAVQWTGTLFRRIPTDDGYMPQRVLHSIARTMCEEIPDKCDATGMSNYVGQARSVYQKYLVAGLLSQWSDTGDPNQIFGIRWSACLDESAKKPKRALARLKDKGLYAPDYFGLCDLMDECCGYNWLLPMSGYITLVAGSRWRVQNFELTDDMWMDCIELYMAMTNPSLLVDPEKDCHWIRYLEDNAPLLWALVLLSALTSYYTSLFVENQPMISALEDAGSANASLQAENVELQKEITRLRAQLQEQSLDTAPELTRLRKQVNALTWENEKLHAQLDSFDDEPVSFNMPSEDVKEADFDSKSDAAAPVQVLHDLPEDGILFLGGHPNMLSKLKPLYPGWMFVETEVCERALPLDMRPKYIFVCGKHMSHALYDRVRSNYQNYPIGYLTATNLDRLQFEMTSLYSQHVNAELEKQ